jgi:hypothetical protein
VGQVWASGLVWGGFGAKGPVLVHAGLTVWAVEEGVTKRLNSVDDSGRLDFVLAALIWRAVSNIAVGGAKCRCECLISTSRC